MRIVVQVVRQSKPFHRSSGATGFLRRRSITIRAVRASPCATTVAQAVPFRPRAGKPSQPNISTGSSTAVIRTAAAW